MLRFGASIVLSDDVSGDRRSDIAIGAPEQDVNGLLNAGEVYFDGVHGTSFHRITASMPQAFPGFGSAFYCRFDGAGTRQTLVGAPFENADLVDRLREKTARQSTAIPGAKPPASNVRERNLIASAVTAESFRPKSDTETAFIWANRANRRISPQALNTLISANFRQNRAVLRNVGIRFESR